MAQATGNENRPRAGKGATLLRAVYCAALSAELLACPFCRQLFPAGEAATCPECGLGLKPLAKLPPSHDALAEEPPEVVPPHMETLSWAYAGRGRALLVALALGGLVAFFGPWVQERAPDLLSYSDFDLGVRLRWIWTAGIAYLVMIPLVLSRRSVHAMRGARFAVGFLAAVVVITVAVRLLFVPSGSALRPVRYDWGWGLYASGAIAVAILAAAARFGGDLKDLPAPPRRDVRQSSPQDVRQSLPRNLQPKKK